jgi:cyclohexanecarboxyl-CoA dehydrogenase
MRKRKLRSDFSMDFKLTEEQRVMNKTIGEFSEKELRPHVRFLDEHGHEASGQERLREIRLRAAKVGLTGLGIPSEYGGTKVPAVTHGVVMEEMGRIAGSNLLVKTSAYGPTELLITSGTEDQKSEYLPRIVRGEMSPLGIAVTEPACGSDVAAITTQAVKEGDEYVINGEKQFVSGVMWEEAMILLCRTGKEPGHKGLSTLIVEMDRPGIEKYTFRGMGWHHKDLGGFKLTNVRVPKENLIGEEGRGFYLMMGMFDWHRGALGCALVGLAQGSIDETIEFARQRKAFGRPIGKFEAVQFRIAESATLNEAARWLSYRVLWLKDEGQPITVESSMVKWWVPVTTFNIVNDCMQSKGAYGYTTLSLDEYKLREIRGYWIGDGTVDIQKMIIGRSLLGREFDPIR